MSSEFITQRGNSGTPSLLKLLFLARFARSLLAAGFFSKGHRLVIANAKVRYGGGRVEKKARVWPRGKKACHVSFHSPLAKMSCLITPTEFRGKNRLPAVYSLKAWRALKWCLTSRQPAANEWEVRGGGWGWRVLLLHCRKNTVVSQFKINITNWNTGWQIAEYRKR